MPPRVSSALRATQRDTGEEAAKSPKKPSLEPTSLLGLLVPGVLERVSEPCGADPVWGHGVLAGTKPGDS